MPVDDDDDAVPDGGVISKLSSAADPNPATGLIA
jgi:hypothetical protein